MDESATLVDLRGGVTARLPRVDLAEVLLEVQAWTNFTCEFRHISETDARLVDYQAQIPRARAWGGGEVASADGLRFVVPVRTLNAGPNPKYFHTGRGVTYYNLTSDQFTGFHAIVVPPEVGNILVRQQAFFGNKKR